MFEMTYGELFLFVWAVAATGAAWQWHRESKERELMLRAAASFTKKVALDDSVRNELRTMLQAIEGDTEFKFGAGD